MATLNSALRNTSGVFDGGQKKFARAVEFTFNFSADATMGTATDVINLATFPGGTVVLAVDVEQVTVGTGTGTVVGRVGTTTATATLASTDAVGTRPATVPAALPLVVPQAGAELNLLGATATRLDGKVKVTAIILEANTLPVVAGIVARDVI